MLSVPGMQDKLRERIRAIFVDLIPAEQLDQAIANEVKSFFEDVDTYTQHARMLPSPFKQLIRTELTKVVTADIHAWLNLNVSQVWDENKRMIVITDVAKTIIPDVQQAVTESFVRLALDAMRRG